MCYDERAAGGPHESESRDCRNISTVIDAAELDCLVCEREEEIEREREREREKRTATHYIQHTTRQSTILERLVDKSSIVHGTGVMYIRGFASAPALSSQHR